ncbi:hypothetical protein LOAG_14643 [Loa loa]|uniref:C2H2-type domain-containing protein n=1 Tax=Loa loa TaxID=7209 RepID=A0A1S0TIC3_LOALO|nr:hypothetical protein LOAG_14643 [Loa loa]EFO13884.2 hypothetical protein LOAG_14643 [Loa loa]
MEKYECPHVDCNATMQGKIKYNEHFQMHDKPFRYQCKHTGCGKEFHNPSSFSIHKKSCKRKPQSPTERNPHIQKHDEHCKQPGNGEEFRSQSPFYRHKKFRQHKPQSPKEGNPLLGHTLKDASLGQQNHSDNESLSYT